MKGSVITLQLPRIIQSALSQEDLYVKIGVDDPFKTVVPLIPREGLLIPDEGALSCYAVSILGNQYLKTDFEQTLRLIEDKASGDRIMPGTLNEEQAREVYELIRLVEFFTMSSTPPSSTWRFIERTGLGSIGSYLGAAITFLLRGGKTITPAPSPALTPTALPPPTAPGLASSFRVYPVLDRKIPLKWLLEQSRVDRIEVYVGRASDDSPRGWNPNVPKVIISTIEDAETPKLWAVIYREGNDWKVSRQFELGNREIHGQHLNIRGDDPIVVLKQGDRIKLGAADFTFNSREVILGASDEKAGIVRIVLPESRQEEVAKIATLSTFPDKTIPVQSIYDDPQLRPVALVRAEGLEFYMSRVVKDEANGYECAVALVPVVTEGRAVLKKRLFYKSQSGGGWRATPYKIMGIFEKLEHYTQVTQPADELLKYLDACSDDPSYKKETIDGNRIPALFAYGGQLLDEDRNRTLLGGPALEIKMFPRGNRLTKIQSYQPGSAFVFRSQRESGGKSAEDLIKVSKALPSDFIPDFSKDPVRTKTYQHSLLGEVILETYAGAAYDGKSVLWTMARDRDERIWCQSIRFEHATITSYGTYDPPIDSGFLTAKPLEYSFQVDLLERQYKRDFNGTYVDISPLLAGLGPIKAYIRAKGIVPHYQRRATGVRIRSPRGGGQPTQTTVC